MIVHCRRAPFDVYIGRPAAGKDWGYGNPFEIDIHGTREEVIAKFDCWLGTGESHGVANATGPRRQWILAHLAELKEKTLGCWCSPLACHGHVLERRANET